MRREARAGLRLVLTAAAVLCAAARAPAHEGPPYPIMVDQVLGPCLVSVWADPDVGTGTFFVIVEPAGGGELPADVAVELGVRPVTGRLPEAVHQTAREGGRPPARFRAEIPFDAEETWRVRVSLRSARGGGEATTDVEVTPPGYGRWDLLIYLLPFAAVGFLWLRAVLKRRGRPAP